MKSCPTCNRTFADETLSFCLVDGAILSAPFDPQATQRLPPNQKLNSQPTEILPSRPELESPPILEPTLLALQPPSLIPIVERETQSQKKSRRWPLVGGVILILMTALAFLAYVESRRKDNLTPKERNTSNANPTSASSAIPQPSPIASNEQASQNASASPTPSIPDLTGTSWRSANGARVVFNSGNRDVNIGAEGKRVGGSWNQEVDRVHMSYTDSGTFISGDGVINGDRIIMNFSVAKHGRVVETHTITLRRVKK